MCSYRRVERQYVKKYSASTDNILLMTGNTNSKNEFDAKRFV